MRCLLLLLVAQAACSPAKIVVLGPPPAAASRASFGDLSLVVDSFEVDGVDSGASTGADGHSDKDRLAFLREQFFGYVREQCSFVSVTSGDTMTSAARRSALHLAVSIHPMVKTHRTWALDILSVLTLGLWPVAPQWGHADVVVSAVATGADGAEVWHAELTDEVPYDMLFFTAYRVNPIEEALKGSYEQVFTRFGAALAEQRDAVLTAVAHPRHGVRIAVLPAQLERGKAEVPALLDDYVLTAVQKSSGLSVIGRDDLNAMLSLEKQRDLVGCDDTACITEIASALDVELLLALRVAHLGDGWVVNAKLIDTRTATVDERANQSVKGDALALLESLPSLMDQLFATHQHATTQRPQPKASP